MKPGIRKLLAALNIGIAWGAAWAALFALLSIVIGIVDPDSIDAGEGPVRIGGIGLVVGFMSGATFASILAFAENRKSIRDISLLRAALWGAVAGAALPLLTTMPNSVLANTIPISAALAVGSMALARRSLTGPRQPRLRG